MFTRDPVFMPIWSTLYVWGFWPLLAVVGAVSLKWGDVGIRWTAIVLLIAMPSDLLLLSAQHWAVVEWGAALIDLLLLIALTMLSLRHPRWWLLTITSIQLLEVYGHFARMLDASMSRLTYAILSGGGAYFQVILLSIGLMLAGRTRRSTAARRA